MRKRHGKDSTARSWWSPGPREESAPRSQSCSRPEGWPGVICAARTLREGRPPASRGSLETTVAAIRAAGGGGAASLRRQHRRARRVREADRQPPREDLRPDRRARQQRGADLLICRPKDFPAQPLVTLVGRELFTPPFVPEPASAGRDDSAGALGAIVNILVGGPRIGPGPRPLPGPGGGAARGRGRATAPRRRPSSASLRASPPRCTSTGRLGHVCVSPLADRGRTPRHRLPPSRQEASTTLEARRPSSWPKAGGFLLAK